MQLLVDNHVLLWLLTGRRKLGPNAAQMLEDADAVHASAATVWELTIKVMRSKVQILDDLGCQLEVQGFRSLDVKGEHAAGIRNFPDLAPS